MKKYISIILSFILLFAIFPVNTSAKEIDTKKIVNSVYSIKLPSWAKVLSSTDDINPTTVITDDGLTLSAKISFESISDNDLVNVRRYLSDYYSNGYELFEKIIGLKASSYEAAAKSYVNASLFYPLNKDYSEYNFKIIDKQNETLYGERSFGIIYNTLDASMNNMSEFSKLDIFIPAYGNGGIYTLNFIVPREHMNVDTALKIDEIITSLKLAGHPAQTDIPLIVSANGNIERSADGIYPAYTFKNYKMKPFYSKEMGLSFYYPDFLLQTDEFTDFSGIKSAAFKIDPYTTFNVSVSDSNFYSYDQAVASALTSIEKDAVNVKSDILDSPNGKIVEVRYTCTQNDVKYKKIKYIMSKNNNTIIYSFVTSAQNPSYSLDNIIIRILMTTKILDTEDNKDSVSKVTYKDIEQDIYKLNLPGDYKIETLDSQSIKVTSPDINTFQIYLYQEDLTKRLDFEAVSRISNFDTTGLIKSEYKPPVDIVNSTCLGGVFDFNEKSSKIYRLSKYLDSSNRLHYCYTVSVSKEYKLYTILIDVNSLLFKEDGRVGETMPDILNHIAQSFIVK